MVRLAQEALVHHGIDDTIVAAGQFAPRGQTAALFAGGMIGSDVGGVAGDAASAVGLGAGSLAGIRQTRSRAASRVRCRSPCRIRRSTA